MIRINDILEAIENYLPGVDTYVVQKAYIFSAKAHQGQVRLSGEPYLSHPLEVAWILTGLKLDIDSIAAGLLHDTVEDNLNISIEDIYNEFGNDIGLIVDGVTKLSKISFSSRKEHQAENIRKMILAMAKDIRVILVKLADRLHNMRTLGYHKPEKQKDIALETLDIFAPIASRLGMYRIKSELEDLAFFYLKPEKYQKIKNNITLKQEEQATYIQEIIDILRNLMKEHGITCRVEGRYKHLYSIYQKMKSQNLEISQIYDIMGFRIIVETIPQCYEALGIIHSKWRPIPGRFKDYIGLPKPNQYQSLHTTVIGPYGERIEIQIRTEDMHRVAEVGIAAHWKYKEKGVSEKDGSKFAWLRSLLEWQQELQDPKEFLQSVKVDLYPEEVYVFTPRGDIKVLPKGATPIDFAYSIHTQVGHTCTGAKVNGRIVPLKYQLKTGDIVEIITSPNHNPSKDWLKIVKTAKARNKIRQWIRKEEREKSLAIGKKICEKEFRRNNLNFNKIYNSGQLAEIAKDFSLKRADDLLVEIGYGKISPKQIITKLLPKKKKKIASFVKQVVNRIKPKSKDEIKIDGVSNLLVRYAKCCNPLPGDEIVGFITRGRGLTVHRADCPILSQVSEERLIDVEWETPKDEVFYPVKIMVLAQDRQGKLAEVSGAISTEANILDANSFVTPEGRVKFNFTIQVKDKAHLDRVFSAIKKLDNIIKVKRMGPKKQIFS